MLFRSDRPEPVAPSLPQVRDLLTSRPDLLDQPDRAWAATALVLHDHPDHGTEALFIQRAERRGDRWSGQMALPGGRRDDGDDDLVHTARREAAEEVGIELAAPIGRLPDVGSRARGGFIATAVFEVPSRPELVLERSEVQAAVWIPMAHLFDPGNAERYRWGTMRFPSIRHGERIVWGLTFGILEEFAGLFGTSLPRP